MLRSDKQLINQLFHYAIIIVVINGYYLHSKLFDCDLSNTNWRTDTVQGPGALFCHDVVVRVWGRGTHVGCTHIGTIRRCTNDCMGLFYGGCNINTIRVQDNMMYISCDILGKELSSKKR